MRIGWDFDGVLYRFTKAYHSWMNERHGMDLDVEVEALTWDWFEEWQTIEEFLQCMDDAVDAKHLFWTGELYEPEIPEYLHKLKAAGHTNHLVTHRFSGVLECPQAATRHFVEENGLVFDSVQFSKDKTVGQTDVFIEDNLNNYDALEAAGIKPFLINRPYNQVDGDNRRRVNSVREFTDLILEQKWQSLACV
jgi:FMN phosphatase YigB (HAD superfamily)